MLHAWISLFFFSNGYIYFDFDKYIRGFEIYCRANGIKGQQKWKDTLLAKGGKRLQKMYFLLLDAVSVLVDDDNKNAVPYDNCVKLLKDYFKAQTSKPYEKYML